MGWLPVRARGVDLTARVFVRSCARVCLRQLFPTLNNWKEKSILSKVMSIINLPIIFFLAITVPVVEIVENSDDGAGGAAEPQSPAKVSPAAAPASPAAAAATTTATVAEVGAASSAAPAKDKELPPDDDEIQAVWNRYLFTLQCFLMPVFVVFGLGRTSSPIRVRGQSGHAPRPLTSKAHARVFFSLPTAHSVGAAAGRQQLSGVGALAHHRRRHGHDRLVHHQV